MGLTIVKEKWIGRVNELSLGTESAKVKAGGESTLPFLTFEGNMPNRPVAALEVLDIEPVDWNDKVTAPVAGVTGDPAGWARKNVEYGADLICLRLAGSHPDYNNKSPVECARTAELVAKAVDVPIIVIGCGIEEKDAQVMTEVGQALAGRGAILGCATPNNYKTMTASCMVNGHSVIASTPMDINLTKQLNILITELGLPPDRIAVDPLVGALGYGIEYAYSIMERIRLSALTGDKMLAMPVICFVGQESWKAREATVSTEEAPEWGDQMRRAILWEVITASTFTQAGGSIIVMRHPESVKQFKNHLMKMMKPAVY